MRRQRMGLIQTDDQLHFALLAISAGVNAANEKTTSHKNILDLNSYSTNATGVSSSQNTLKCNSLSPFQENGDSLEKHEIDNMKSRNIASVDGIKSILSNGKTRNLDGNSSHKTRKRSTDRDTYEDECEQELDRSETKEGFEEGLRSQSSNEISAHLTAKRKKSEKDC